GPRSHRDRLRRGQPGGPCGVAAETSGPRRRPRRRPRLARRPGGAGAELPQGRKGPRHHRPRHEPRRHPRRLGRRGRPGRDRRGLAARTPAFPSPSRGGGPRSGRVGRARPHRAGVPAHEAAPTRPSLRAARPPRDGEGQPPLPPAALRLHPRRMTKQPRTRKHRPILTVVAILVGLVLGSVAIHRLVPPPLTFLMVTRAVEGEGLSYRWKPLDDISPRLVEAVIAAEDARFCSHRGFDLEAIEKALRTNEKGGRLRGGSTISQQ